MSDKPACQYCGSEAVHSSLWKCGTHSFFQSHLCVERAAHNVTKQESASHASTATILGFECQRLQAEVNDLKKRLSAFTDL